MRLEKKWQKIFLKMAQKSLCFSTPLTQKKVEKNFDATNTKKVEKNFDATNTKKKLKKNLCFSTPLTQRNGQKK